MYLKFKKTHQHVKSPQRENWSDAGLDVFWNPEDGVDKQVILKPGENYLFGTGIKIEIPHGFALLVKNRSGNAAKKCLVKGAQCIDAGYSGEILIDLHNIGIETQIISFQEKIAQLILVPVLSFGLVESDEIYTSQMTISNRGDTGFGHSG